MKGPGRSVAEKDWLTLQQIAELLGVRQEKVRQVVKTLRNSGEIKVRTNPNDNRILWIHRDGLPLIHRALGLDDESPDSSNGNDPRNNP